MGPLDLLGYGSGLTALGIAGYELWGAGKSEFAASPIFAKAVENISDLASRSNVAAHSTISTANPFDIKPQLFRETIRKSASEILESGRPDILKDFLQGFGYNRGEELSSELVDLVRTAQRSAGTRDNVYLKFSITKDNALSMSLVIGDKRHKLGFLTKAFGEAGAVTNFYPSVNQGYNFRVGANFLSPETVADVISGKISSMKELSDRALDVSQMTVRSVKGAIERGITDTNFIAKRIEQALVATQSPPQFNPATGQYDYDFNYFNFNKSNRVIAVKESEREVFEYLSPVIDEEMINAFHQKLSGLQGFDEGYIAGRSTRELAEATFNTFPIQGGTAGNPFRQTIGKSTFAPSDLRIDDVIELLNTRFPGTSGIAHPGMTKGDKTLFAPMIVADTPAFYRQALLGPNATQAEINAFNLNPTTALNTLLETGLGNVVKDTPIPMAGVKGTEAVILSEQLARRRVIDPNTKILKFEGEAGSALNESYKILDQMMFDLAVGYKLDKSTVKLSSNQATAAIQENILNQMSNFIDAGGRTAADMSKRWKISRTAYRTFMKNATPEQIERFIKLRNELAPEAADLFNKFYVETKVGFKYLEGGQAEIVTRNNKTFRRIRGADLTTVNHVSTGRENALRLHQVTNRSLGKGFKIHGHLKAIEAGRVVNPTRLASRIYAINQYIANLKDPAQARAVFNELNSARGMSKQQLIDFNKRLFGKGGKFSKYVQEFYKLGLSNYFKDTIFTTEPVRGMDFNLLKVSQLTTAKRLNLSDADIARIGSSTNQQELIAAMQSIADPRYKKMMGGLLSSAQGGMPVGMHMAWGAIGAAVSPGKRGFSINETVRTNADTLRYLLNTGKVSMAQEVIDKFPLGDYKNLFTSYAPTIAGEKFLPKDAAIIDSSSVLPSNLKILTEGPELRSRASIENLAYDIYETQEKIAGRTPKEFKNNMKFFIHNPEADVYVPVMDFENPSFIGTFKESERNIIQKQLTKVNRQLVSAKTKEEIASSMHIIQKIMFSEKRWFRTREAGMAVLEARNSGALGKTFLESLTTGMAESDVSSIFGKYGITNFKEIDDRAYAGLTTNAFNKRAVNSKDYQRMLSEGLSPQDALAALRKEGIYAIGTREPVGRGVVKMVDAESLLSELMTKRGYSPSESTAAVKRMMSETQASLTSYGQFIMTADDDSDTLTLVDINKKSSAGKEAMSEFYAEPSHLYRSRTSPKAIKNIKDPSPLSSVIASGSELNINKFLESSLSEISGVGRGSNLLKDFTYTALKHGDLTDIEKLNVMHMEKILRENFIGGKGILGKSLQAKQDFFELFAPLDSSKDSITERASRFKSLIEQDEILGPQLKNQDNFIYKIVKSMSKRNTDMVYNYNQFASRLKYTQQDPRAIESIFNMAMGTSPEDSSGSLIDVFQGWLKQNQSVPKRGLTGIANTSEGAMKGLWRNKAFKIAGGVALATALLKPADRHIDHQEIREESTPKGSVPTHGHAIDPKTGSVYKPGPQGYHINVRGVVPGFSNDSHISRHMRNMGVPYGGTMNVRSPGVDADYVSKLQYENDSLKWNG